MTFRAEDFFLEAVWRRPNLKVAYNMEEHPVLANTRDTTKFKDLSPEGNHGTIGGAVTIVAGKFGKAGRFDGTGTSFVDGGDVGGLMSKFTMGCWQTIGTKAPVQATPHVLSKELDQGGGREGPDIFYNKASDFLAAQLWNGGTFEQITLLAAGIPVVDRYYRTIITYDSALSSNRFKGYIDGAFANQTGANFGTIDTIGTDFYIGARPTGGNRWEGDVDNPFLIVGEAWTLQDVIDDFENGGIFIIPKAKISSWKLEEVDEDLLDISDLVVDNVAGEFNDYFKTGAEVKVYLRTEIDTETKWIWTGIVKTPTIDHSRSSRASLAVSLGDFVYEILRERQLFDSFTAIDSAQILKDAIEDKAPEIDTSQIVLGAKVATIVSRGLYLKDLGFKLARHAGYQLGGDFLKQILFFPVGTDDSGILIDDQKVDNVAVGPDDAALANVVRVQGGEGTGLISEQTTQTALFTVTDTTRKQTKIRTPKRKVKEVEIFTDPTGFTGPLRVRIQADDGTGTNPVAIGDATRDLSQKELASPFLAVNGFTTFLMPEHILGAGVEYWIIVESSSVGQRVGEDGGGNLTFRANFAFPIIEQLEEPLSIDSELRRREIDITDATIQSKQEATDRARIEIAKRAFAERVLSVSSRDTDLLSIRPGQGASILLPDEGITNEKFILHKRTWDLEDAILRVDLDLVEEERLVEAADVIKNILERIGKIERVQAQLTGEDIVDIFQSIADEYGYADAATLTVDVVAGMIWGTDSWGLEVWSR